MTSFYPYIILSLWLAGLQSFMVFLHGLTRLSAHRQAQLVLQSKLRAEEAPKSWWYVQSWTVEPGTTSHWLLQRYRMCQEEKHQAASNVEVQVVKPHDMRNPSPAWYLKKSRNILTHFVRKNAAVECLRVAIPRNQPCLPRHRSTAGGSNISKASTQSGIESKLSALDFQTKMGVSSFSDRRFWWTLFSWTSWSLWFLDGRCAVWIWMSCHVTLVTGGSPMSEPSKASSQCSYVKHLAGSPGEMMLALGAWVRSHFS